MASNDLHVYASDISTDLSAEVLQTPEHTVDLNTTGFPLAYSASVNPVISPFNASMIEQQNLVNESDISTDLTAEVLHTTEPAVPSTPVEPTYAYVVNRAEVEQFFLTNLGQFLPPIVIESMVPNVTAIVDHIASSRPDLPYYVTVSLLDYQSLAAGIVQAADELSESDSDEESFAADPDSVDNLFVSQYNSPARDPLPPYSEADPVPVSEKVLRARRNAIHPNVALALAGNLVPEENVITTTRPRPPCPFCPAVSSSAQNCSFCTLEADLVSELFEPTVRFGSDIVHNFDPAEIIDPPLFEPVPSDDGITLSKEVSLLDLNSRSNLSESDRRLSEIISSYFHKDPAEETLLQKVKSKVSQLSATMNRGRNPFIGSDLEEIFSAMENLYNQSVFEDLSVCDDSYERVLKIFRDHSNWTQFEDKKVFNDCAQALRCRFIDKKDKYMTVCYLQDAFTKNRENKKKNRQRNDEFESQMFSGWTLNHQVPPEVVHHIESMTESVDHALKQMDETLKTVSSAADTANDVLKALPVMVTVLFFALMCSSGNKKLWGPLLVAGIATVVSLHGYEIRNKINSYIDQIVSEDSEVLFESQANNENPVIGLALLLTSLTALGEAPRGKRSTHFLKGIGELPKLTDGLTSVTAFIIDLVVRCVNEVKTMLYGSDVDEWVVKTVPEVDEWCLRVRTLAQEYHDGRFALTMGNRDRVFALELQASQIAAKVFAGIEGIRVKNALIAYNKQLKKLSDAFACVSPSRKGIRQEPYVVVFNGPPGVGKSWMMRMFIARFLCEVLPTELLDEFRDNDGNFMYQRFFEEEYFTGFVNQWVTIIDDFMQAVDVLGQPGEPLEFIRMVNSAPYTLHMADLGSKGRVDFTSKLIVVNSNMKNWPMPSISNIEAFLRRVNYEAHTSTAPEFCTPKTSQENDPWKRRLDRSNPALQLDGIQRFNPDVYEIHRARRPNLGEHPDQFFYDSVHNFEEMLETCVKEYKRGEKVSDLYMKDYRDTIVQGVQRRKEMESQAGAGIREIPRFMLKKIPIEGVDSLTLADLDIDDSADLTSQSAATLLPGIPQLHSLGNARDIALFVEKKYPYLWAQFAQCSAVQYCAVDRHCKSNFCDLVGLVLKIRSTEVRARQMDKYICEYLTHDFLTEESTLRKDLMSHFDDVRTKAEDLIKNHPMLWKMVKITTVLGSVSLVIFGVWKAFAAFEASPADFVSESHPKNKGTSRPRRNNNRGVQRTGPAQFVTEAGGDDNNTELCKKLVRKSMYKMTFGDKKLGNCFVYRGHHAVVPFHYVTLMRGRIRDGLNTLEDEIILTNYFTKVPMPLDINILLGARMTDALVDRDLCVFVLPTHFHAHPDMLPHFATAATHAKNLSFDCTLVTPDDVLTTRDRLRATPIRDVEVKNPEERFLIVSAYSYNCATNKGDCGSLLTLDEVSVKDKILGMHIAGTTATGVGMASCLVREEFQEVEEVFERLGMRTFPPPEIVVMESQADVPPAPGFHPYFVLPKKIYGPTESKIRKSLLYGAIATVKTQPAPLKKFTHDGVVVDPRFNALSRYSAPCISAVSPDTVALCTQSLYAHMMRNSGPFNKISCLTFEDAILGQPGVRYFDAIPRNTSAGYPYVMNPKPGYHHKEWFFGKAEEYDLTRPSCQELKEDVLDTIEKAKLGIRKFHPFIDVLKDETISHKKAEIGKTRLVSACPLPLTVATRMMFMSFSTWMMTNHGANSSAVGCNPYESWHYFATMLKSKGPNIVAGDFSGYDSRQLSVILLSICDMINQWYDDGEENRLCRLTLFQEIINSIHISGDTVYQWASKLPSGHPLTSILNTCQAIILCLLCWVDLNPQGELGLENFWKEVAILAFGDDNILNISIEASAYYNLKTITESMKKWNQIYTDETKEEVDYLYKPLEEATFLKRGFRFDERFRRYVAPLALDSILDMLNWYTEGPERLFVQQTNVETALKELSLHDQETFDFWSDKILTMSRHCLNFTPPLIQYRALQDACMARELVW